ncbi:MAG: glycogen/starch/alpha-glucan phosphorylase [Paracoccus sp. (in: a-proteobacteria)]|uniref:glycogen/starch/alpha-glucan phosphorylase n=1 Tax=Paracoccus sp. TaxID=267 RepID=UPI0026DF181E|nr:glycogen/starch/alpha-glucan phosphorylase [Paracoccus sp. (in: a-proteobacteria)]MDO5631665.1 glycogen/starch/alpha-glucan phosphorylase [Paracoccus sp. (in: a-proteobacteria)]
MTDPLTAPTTDDLVRQIQHHLTFTIGKDAEHASTYDWRMAVSHTIRDLMVGPWFAATRATYDQQAKRVYYLSMEFLIGRILGDAIINLGLDQEMDAAFARLGLDRDAVLSDEPDAALGNGGLGRLAACFMESLASLQCPAYGYGIRYEHGLFRQRFEGGRQVESPEDWLDQSHPWEFTRPESSYVIGFKGHVEHVDGRAVWHPTESVEARAYDTPVIGWGGHWANTLRLWGAHPTTLFDLHRFNAGDYTAAAAPEALARTLSRVLYPDDTTEQGKELRLKQEYFLTAAALHDILRRFMGEYGDLRRLPEKVAIQLNDTHPAIAGPELIRLLMDDHGFDFAEARDIARGTLNYTNHTLLPEALETWPTWLFGRVLPRHMQIVEMIDADHRAATGGGDSTAIVRDDHVHMGELAFIMVGKVNGVSALHSDLVRSTVFADLHRLHPDRILNETNGVTPRRWLRMANPPLAHLLDDTIGTGWTTDLNELSRLETHAGDAGFQDRLRAAKRENKVALADGLLAGLGVKADPDAIFDVQVKRIHEYKRQLLNILETIALWQRMHDAPNADWTPRVKIFGGKAAPGYWLAKDVIYLINSVARVVNNDPVTKHLLQVAYPPNYNVSMAERLIPAADLSEQISTAGKEASGTGNMKFTMNGALTIGTLDGANVEIRELVGAENFFLFGMDAEQAQARVTQPGHARAAIEASPHLKDALVAIATGRFSDGATDRFNTLLDRTWNDDPFLVASDFDSYFASQRQVDAAYADHARWDRMAALNIARSGFFSSDRTIRGYMDDIWQAKPVKLA